MWICMKESLIQLFLFPAFFQKECGIFRLSVSGEDTFLVAVDTHNAFGRLEVRKVPCQLACDEVIGIKYAEVFSYSSGSDILCKQKERSSDPYPHSIHKAA